MSNSANGAKQKWGNKKNMKRFLVEVRNEPKRTNNDEQTRTNRTGTSVARPNTPHSVERLKRKSLKKF